MGAAVRSSDCRDSEQVEKSGADPGRIVAGGQPPDWCDMRRGEARRAGVLILVLAATLAAGCGAGRSYTRGERVARAGDWDAAVEYYRKALQGKPDRTEYKIALESAMINASHLHQGQARGV